MNTDLKKVAGEFGLHVETCEQAKNSVLSQTFIVNETHILRSRKLHDDTLVRFKKEQALVTSVKSLSSLEFPELMPCKSGEAFVIQGNLLWAAYPLIAGDVQCSWWNLENLDDDARKDLYKTLKILHGQTMGKLVSIPGESIFLNDIRRWLIDVPGDTLDTRQCTRLEQALSKVRNFEQNLSEKDLCFIHGDYHPGNIVFRENKVAGLIDLDWSRKGYYMEDLAYTLMTLMRDFRRPIFVFNKDEFDAALQGYGLRSSDMSVFWEYMLLAVFYDLYLMRTLPELRDKTHLVPFQLSFLDDLLLRR
ncbi:aminoglycoside phosphotransferase family protein [Candidatus Kaiserbacteria bacterium]|nr:aminoglycoside phosphotransferase family protein [Candidatus Kaiserbacteria bacterium]